MIKLNSKIGRYTLQIEFKTMKELHKFGSIYGNLPQKCTACGSDNIFLSYKNPQDSDYFMIACGDCTATANFGIHKNEAKSLYWKNDKMTVYVPSVSNPLAGCIPSNDEQKTVEPQQVANELSDFEPPTDNDEAPF